ncbi:uracil-DNA glycosylase [Agromyces intestinalis]|nr:uracil-DNA glycosylase [Agromyces intestinalis]
MFLDAPRGFRDPARIDERVAMLETAPRVAPLREWANALASRRNAVVPLFDPAEAGVEARVLMLFEAPGPMTNADNKRPGSGFISVDNDDQSAENVWRARDAVGLHDGVLAWNIVPWYLGPASKKPNAVELGQGGMELRRLLPLLSNLAAVVLAGRLAQTGWTKHVAPFIGNDLAVIETWHPSPLSFNQPGHRDDFTKALSRAARYA